MTTTTPTGRPKVDLKDPADLLAAIPYILGFHPEDSVVVFGQRGPDRKRQGLTLRVDLPPPGLEKDQALDLAARLAATAHTGATVAVIGGGAANPAGRPPRRRFVRRLESALAEYGIPLLHPLWVPRITAGARWGCYRDRTCGGVLPDPRESVMAAFVTSDGRITRESREELERLFDPGPPETLARRADLLTRLADPPWGEGDIVEAALAEVNAALDRFADGDQELTDDQVVRLAWALSLVEVRGACLLTAAPAESPLARTAEELWLRLAGELPEPESAEALCLKAHAAYARGDLTVAGMALARACEVDPDHGLARLLTVALDAMLPPSELAGIVLRQREEGPPPTIGLRLSGGTA
ncbi:hypothetical protein SD37_12955 [Amycolatopsis orientalis]|uniref:DUF4192 domain-containing protein n=1 Tax=Amycolatopsis orientalis TaxID=31958 RepID=A0A193BW59_AMYOR|nr:DUF4192 domain-containing protein [Amycolatopsis orientalis]ANN16471.1 hypothetical protein SD37_12955 [Amycolatopsis orientalis]